MSAAEDRADADMVMSVLLASPNRDEPGALLAAAKAYQALKSSRERAVRRGATIEGAPHSMSDITVNVSGTWSAKQRANNGLDLVAAHVRKEWLDAQQVVRIPVVGYVEYHNWHHPLSGKVLVVSIPVIEPGVEADGADPNGAGARLMEILDQLRKQRGKGASEDVPPRAGELAGQISFDFDGDGGVSGEVRLGPDGEHVVPEASGEELMAERAEAAAAGVPAASFSGGEDA